MTSTTTPLTDLIQELNRRFGGDGSIAFAADPGGLPLIEVANAHATARIALNGGCVLAYAPHGQPPVLFLSEHAVYRAGKAIRGGIPVCWPWFGPHPTDPGKPQHGFARTALWRVSDARTTEGSTRVHLELHDSEVTRALWPPPFVLQLLVDVGPALAVTLVAHNPSAQPYACTAALHSYLTVGDVNKIRLEGLDGVSYVDKAGGDLTKSQRGPVIIERETDRVYTDTAADVAVIDPVLGRRIVVSKQGSRSTVVWNPWVDKARALSDFGDDEYLRMVCVETANALDDAITIPPGGEHRLQTIITALPT